MWNRLNTPVYRHGTGMTLQNQGEVFGLHEL